MSEQRVEPADCRSMGEVRRGVDLLDKEIVPLLAERFRYMEAAARIKPARDAVRDEERKAEVLANVRRLARAHGGPEEEIRRLYEQLVEASIAYELDCFDRSRG